MRGEPAARVRLFVSDIDGTLVTPEKTLTPAAEDAVSRLHTAGLPFTIVSSRPARGMAALVAELGLTVPFAAFNGGSLVAPNGRLIAAKRLAVPAAREAIRLFRGRGVETWGFADNEWLVLTRHGPHVDHERRTVGFAPTLVASFESVIDRLDKLVAVSDDAPLLAEVEHEAQGLLAGRANARRSQTYYLDVTHPDADKGHAVAALAAEIGAPLAETAVIGDQVNDLAMFEVAGLAIAMGQGAAAVLAGADFVTDANTADGFAHAVDRYILPRVHAGQPRP
jgi:hypothetical protein